MNIEKQIIDQRIKKIIEENPTLFQKLKKDEGRCLSLAFLYLGIATYLDKDVADIVSYVTDGGDDGGFDAAFWEIKENNIEVILFQSKYVKNLEKDSSFPANAIEKAVATIKTVFDPKLKMQLNEKSLPVVEEIRSQISEGYIPYVTFVMLNNGNIWNQDAQNKIDNTFKGSAQVLFKHFNHHDIFNAIATKKDINTSIHFSGKAVGEQLIYRTVVTGRVSVTEIAQLMGEHGDLLLERNVRKFLGENNSVNKDIAKTLLSDKDNFFFYNNGITIICKSLRYNELQSENWIVHADGIQIINGGQTCRVIYETVENNPHIDFSNVYAPVKMYAVNDDNDWAIGVTKATNTQSPIDLRDLRANEIEQKILEDGAKNLGYEYKRKRDKHINTKADMITSSVAAESVFVVWSKKPHLVSRKRSDFFGSCYDEIFKNLNAAQMIIAVLIYRYCDNMRHKKSKDAEVNSQRPYSQYIIAAIIGDRILNDLGISLEQLTHENFIMAEKVFGAVIEIYYQDAEEYLIKKLQEHFNTSLINLDGRTLSATLRRFEFIEKIFEV